jgi:hypothetical protein
MNVLIACEFSGRVRDAFIARGHDAWSCDLLPSEGRQGNHLQGDVRFALDGNLWHYPLAMDIRTGNRPIFKKWDMLIAHPPCTYLCNSGVRWLYKNGKGKKRDQERWDAMYGAVAFFRMFQDAPIARIVVENPIMHGYARAHIGDATQTIQPWQFGDGETKATCLWLKNLPPLVPTDIVAGRKASVHLATPGPNRWKERSRTYQGIANAMATQWSKL